MDAEAQRHETAAQSRTGTDPICGMTVDLDRPKGGKVIYQGREIGFCSPKCKAKFQANPEKYLGAKSGAPPAAPSGTTWVCPMDPEVEADAPGPCPKCGMALEPRSVSLEEKNPELADMTRRFWASLLFTVPVFLLGMSD